MDGAQRAGFFRLKTPLDLLKKMEFHFDQLMANPLDEYAAFDFFVAAAHLPEWLGRFGCNPGDGDAREMAMRRLCTHLAVGAKHFVPDERHVSFRAMTHATPARSGIARSGITFSGGLLPKPIVLLEDDAAAALGVPVVSTIALAQMVLIYWQGHAAIKRAAAKSV